MEIILNIDLEKFRYSLIGDGYLKEEVEKIRINLLQNTCSINKKNIGNNSSNNLNNLTSNNNKIIHSNASTSSFGRNFILKSDVCKSSISNQVLHRVQVHLNVFP